MIFTGHAELTIDAKQRLAIPSKYRQRLTAEADGTAWYCLPYGENKLVLYTERRYEEMAEQGAFTLTPDANESKRASAFFGITERIDPDSAGRIIIPRLHREIAQLGDDVVMVGCGKYIEIWDKAVWEREFLPQYKNMAVLMGQLSKPRSGT
jgi:MraZ protein